MRLNAAEQRVRDLKEAVAGIERKFAIKDQTALVKVPSGSPIRTTSITRRSLETWWSCSGVERENAQTSFRQRPSTYKISAAPTGARAAAATAAASKGAARVEICARAPRPPHAPAALRRLRRRPVRGGRAGRARRAERVPVEAALAGSAEAQRVQRAIDAAREGGGG